jgi:phosphatidylserine/phosphatidylglycerophosphate/cardiolipin synthase-like enzyme
MIRDPLLAVIIEIADSVPASLIETTARAVLAAGDAGRAERIPAAVAQPDYARLVEKLAIAWRSQVDVTSGELAAMLRAAAASRASATRESRVEVVWTGPDSHHVPSRSTEAAVLEVVNASIRKLLLVTYAAYRYEPLVAALLDAQTRGVQTSVLVETRAGAHPFLGAESADAFRGIAGVTLYEWPVIERVHGNAHHQRMHAKLVIADRDVAFVTSANLTGNGIEENLECGLLVTGGAVPGRLADHVDALTRRGIFRPLKTSVPPFG